MPTGQLRGDYLLPEECGEPWQDGTTGADIDARFAGLVRVATLRSQSASCLSKNLCLSAKVELRSSGADICRIQASALMDWL